MPPETSSALKLWVVMTRAARSIEEHLRRQVEAHGLSLTEFGVLEVLLHRGPLPIGELGGRLLLASGSMTYVVDKLTQRGLIQRRASDTDRRVTRAELTPEGRSLIELVFSEHAALIRDLTGGLEPEEVQTATDLLRRLGSYAQAFSPPGVAAS